MGIDNSHLRSFRIKIDDEMQTQITDELRNNNVDKQQLVSDAADWFVGQRVIGALPPRYFASPHNANYECLWVKRETAQRLHKIAESDGTKASRVLYTALARYIENLKEV
ncbi:hypothetical protein [Pectobacterium versatile]|uniref:hypothetical protein n=1 Tax=Pectobacterium versatile TaxID=2488639 RepID=UPI001F3128A7|nr:hypothetical protein [Pectobacterium versatile]